MKDNLRLLSNTTDRITISQVTRNYFNFIELLFGQQLKQSPVTPGIVSDKCLHTGAKLY
jgi:hypothetical protein